MKAVTVLTFSLTLITVVPGKVIYRQSPTGLLSTNNQLFDTINRIDVDVNTLANVNSQDVYDVKVPASGTMIDNNVLSGLGSHHGLAVDWPNTGTFNENYHTLSNYFQISPRSQFLVHLDAVPDFVLSPQESLFATSMSDPRLLEMKTLALQQLHSGIQDITPKHNVLSTSDSLSINFGPDLTNNAHHNQELPYSSFSHEFNVADSNSVVNLPDTKTLVPDIKDKVLVNNENSLSVHSGDTVNIDPNLELPNQSKHSYFDKSGLHVYMKTLPPLLIDVKNTDSQYQQHHDLVKRAEHSIPTQNLGIRVNQQGGDSNLNQEAVRNDQLVNTARSVQFKEVERRSLPPLTDIFGGESLFKPKQKVVRFFSLSPKHDALRRFEG